MHACIAAGLSDTATKRTIACAMLGNEIVLQKICQTSRKEMQQPCSECQQATRSVALVMQVCKLGSGLRQQTSDMVPQAAN